MTIMGQIGQVSRSLDASDAASDFLRYVRTEARRVRLASQGHYVDAPELAEAERPASHRLKAMLEMPAGVFETHAKAMSGHIDARQLQDQVLGKAAVAVGGIGTWGSALAPYAQAAVAFLQTLSPYSSFDRLINDNAVTRLPLRTRIAVATAAAVGSAVSEGLAKPLTLEAFIEKRLDALKCVAQIVLSDELVLSTVPAASRLFEAELQKAIAKATDQAFVSILVAGAGSTHASTGTDIASFLGDLKTALQSIQTDVNSRIYLILPVNTYKGVSLLQSTGGLLLTDQTPSSGKIGPITVVASSGATTTGVFLDASSVGADSDIVTTTVSREATVQLADNPTSSSYQLVSAFQENLTAIRCERYFGAVVMRANGVATITGYS